MPHILIKMQPGRPDALKQELADAIVKTTMDVIGVPEGALSVAIEDVPGRDWMELVFEPDIRGNRDRLFKVPDYKEL